jgi:2-polyprenyl-3-methyl-5-hydroxy-6-metoxy-1,4-benzoquinol methylase
MRDIEDYSKKYHTEPGEYYQALYRKKMLVDVIHKYDHRNILEIGCGLDPLFLYIESFDTYTVIDPSDDFIENAESLSCGDNRIKCLKAYFEKAISDELFTTGEFDFVICSSLLHELENPRELLSCINSICDKNTIVHINVPNANSFHRIIAKEMGLITDVHELSEQQIRMQRHHVYDMKMLTKLVTEMGFDVIESGSYYPKFLTGSQMDAALEQGIISDKIFEGLYSLGRYVKDYGSEIFVNVRLKSKG